MTKLTAPQPGDTVTITATVLTSDQYADGRHYGPSARVVLKIQDEVGGYRFANCFLTADSAGRWFTKPAETALKRLENGEDISAPKPKPAPKAKVAAEAKTDDAPAPKAALDPPDDEDLAGFTMKQLRALADRKKIAYPSGAKKAELVAIVRDGLQAEAA